jgi:hypothetical protein
VDRYPSYLAIIPTLNSPAIIKLYQVDQTIFKMASALNISAARSRFPALQQDQVYMDNAGGVDLHFIAAVILRFVLIVKLQAEVRFLILWLTR